MALPNHPDECFDCVNWRVEIEQGRTIRSNMGLGPYGDMRIDYEREPSQERGRYLFDSIENATRFLIRNFGPARPGSNIGGIPSQFQHGYVHAIDMEPHSRGPGRFTLDIREFPHNPRPAMARWVEERPAGLFADQWAEFVRNTPPRTGQTTEMGGPEPHLRGRDASKADTPSPPHVPKSPQPRRRAVRV